MADTIIVLGNARPLEVFETVTLDSHDVRRIKSAALPSDTVTVAEREHPPEEEGGAPQKAHVVRVERVRKDLGNRETTMGFPEGWTDDEVLVAVRKMWREQSVLPPDWVEGDDAHLAESVARLFRVDGHECPVGRPDGWTEG